MNIPFKIKNCFLDAKKLEAKGKKHKGLFVKRINIKQAEEYVEKAKTNLRTCDLFKEQRLDYKIPEEWFYTMYYCALAILARFGVESRSQKCTALFLHYIKNRRLINYDDEFIERITVFSDKNKRTSVDEREDARYSSSVRSEEIMQKYDMMVNVCKRCISQCEEIVFSEKEFKIPEELLK